MTVQRWVAPRRWFFIFSLALLSFVSNARPTPPGAPIVLCDATAAFEITDAVSSWLEQASNSSIENALSSAAQFEWKPMLQRQPLNPYQTLWIRIPIRLKAGSTVPWTLNVPLPFVDQVRLHQQDAEGHWYSQVAGDTLAQSDWNHRENYPEFSLELKPGQVQDVYLEVHNFKNINVPIRLSQAPARDTDRLREHVLMGMVMGLLLAMAITSFIRSVQYRSKPDAWACLYGLLVMCTVGQFNGVLNALVLHEVPKWGDMAGHILPLMAVGSTLIFLRHLYSLSVQYHRFDRTLVWTAAGTIASATCFLFLDRELCTVIASMAMLWATLVALVATLANWRNGSTVARWMMLAFVPQGMLMVWFTLEGAGFVPTLWELRYVMSGVVALIVPLMLYTLGLATHDRKLLRNRSQQLTTQDALTGLSNREGFMAAYRSALQRVHEGHEPVALAVVQVVNYNTIKTRLGDTVGEQCVLRAVVKLHRVMRDIDQGGRTDAAKFALLLEGMTSRQEVTERMVKLIASGLIPLSGLKPEVTLQFHVACVLLHENPVPADEVLERMDELLQEFSSRTRRPIRFLDPAPTQAAALETGPDAVY
jgi:diguanylate cyclase (GGDEF)-like protein